MKLAICYTVFNGYELLEKSLHQIYDLVDNVVICYQTTSNKGNTCDIVEPYLRYHFAGKSKVTIIYFSPDLNKNTKHNERVKHQLMLDEAKKLNSTHFLISATDHFYDPQEFASAKQLVKEKNYDLSLTKMYTYYKHPTWRLTPIENYYMPFIMRLHDYTRIEQISNYPVRVDPSVQVNTFFNHHIFSEKSIMMHHYSMIREDIVSKFTNAAASFRWKPEAIRNFISEYNNYDLKSNPGISYFGGRKIIEVENLFNI